MDLINIIDKYMIEEEDIEKCIQGRGPTWMYLKPTSPLMEGEWKHAIHTMNPLAKENISRSLVVTDIDQSMFISSYKPSPMVVAVTIALTASYCGVSSFYKDRFCVLDDELKLCKFTEDSNLAGRMFCLCGYPVKKYDTNDPNNSSIQSSELNLEKLYKNVLQEMKSCYVKKENEVDTIYIITNKKFDAQKLSLSGYQMGVIEQLYSSAHFRVPRIIYWNTTNDGCDMVSFINDSNMTIINGYSSMFLEDILGESSGNQFVHYATNSEIVNEDGKNEFTFIR